MNEVQKCLENVWTYEEKTRILKSIEKNELTKPHCKEIATQLLSFDKRYN